MMSLVTDSVRVGSGNGYPSVCRTLANFNQIFLKTFFLKRMLYLNGKNTQYKIDFSQCIRCLTFPTLMTTFTIPSATEFCASDTISSSDAALSTLHIAAACTSFLTFSFLTFEYSSRIEYFIFLFTKIVCF